MIYTKEGELESNLRAALASFTGRPVGIGRAPFDEGANPDFPYAIIYPSTGGNFQGSLAYPDEDAVWRAQVTSVGTTPEQARWMSSRVRRYFMLRGATGSFVSAINPGSGWLVNDRQITSPGSLEPGKKALFSVPESYALSITVA